MKQKLAKYISEYLVSQGITENFTVTGGGAMHLNDAFGHQVGMHSTYNHHEQASAMAADAYARISGKMALCCVTSGPGGTNALTGVVGAWLDSVPMLVISGQVKRETTIWSVPEIALRQLGDQEFDIINSIQNMTKYGVMVTDPDTIAFHLEKAIYLAANGRSGPVWLDIPLDVQASIIDTDKLKHFDCNTVDNENPIYNVEFSDKILDKITKAKRPVMLVGVGVRFGKAQRAMLKLVEKLNIPVVTAWNAHDLVTDDNACYCGRPGSLGTRGGNFVVQNSDLLLVLGCRLTVRQIGHNWTSFAKNAYKIVIDIDESELKKPTLSIDMPIHANVKDVIEHLLSKDYEQQLAHKEWLSWAINTNLRYPVDLKEYYEKETPLNPYVFCKALSELCREGEVTILGNGSACVMMLQASIIKEGQRLFTNSGCSSMGFGLPAALGGCIANKNNRVVCVDGDGSFMMNMQELQTIATNNLNIKIFILNNNGYHSIRQTQGNMFQTPFVGIGAESHDLGFPNFEKLADAFGVGYSKINSQVDLSKKINIALNSSGPTLCEVVVDQNQIFAPKLSSKVQEDGTIVSPEVDDMFPFLSREEYLSNKL